MPDGSIPLLISLFVLIAFSAFFSATETAYTSTSRIRLKSLASSGNRKAEKVLQLCELSYDKLLSTILIGNNIVNLSASTITALLFAKLLSGTTLNSSLISTVVITIVVLIFGEITPKYIGKFCAEKFAMAVYPLISAVIFIFYPLNIIFSLWKKFIVKIFRFNSKDVITEEEIITMVEEAEEDGTIKQEETNLIRSVIQFDDLDAKNILVPRVNICAVEENSSIEEIMKKFEESGFSRLPVYQGKIDSIVGIIHEKDFFKITAKKDSQLEERQKDHKSLLKSIMQKPFFTTEKTKISKLFRQMQKERTHMMIVIDEYGGTSGIVTMEDILEELVGEIYDEHDNDESECIKPYGENTFIISGETSLNKMMKYFNLEQENSTDSNTVSGWIIETLGDFPQNGQKLCIQDKIEIEILKTDKNTVQNVKIVKM